jgi:hypothetical protein
MTDDLIRADPRQLRLAHLPRRCRNPSEWSPGLGWRSHRAATPAGCLDVVAASWTIGSEDDGPAVPCRCCHAVPDHCVLWRVALPPTLSGSISRSPAQMVRRVGAIAPPAVRQLARGGRTVSKHDEDMARDTVRFAHGLEHMGVAMSFGACALLLTSVKSGSKGEARSCPLCRHSWS